jgi:signal transduction histidine kinase/ligand-binding sensor domain-containing protein
VRFFWLIFWLIALPTRADESTVLPKLLVRVWQSQDGLPGNVVRSVIQASDGYLWVATAEGVARFDGFEFQVIEPEGELRRFRLAFSRLFATSGGKVWAATYQGGLFQVENDKLIRILENLRQPRPPIVTQLIEGPDGVVYFKRGEEIGRIVPGLEVGLGQGSPEIKRAFEEDLQTRLAGGRVFDPEERPVLHDRSGRVWTAGAAGGLSVVTGGSGAAIAVEIPQRGQAFEVNELMEDREGCIWAASPVNGLFRIHQARVNVLDTNEGENERAVSAVLQDQDGVWWIANRRGGLNRWTPEESRYVQLSPSRFYRPAAALFEDRDQRLWVASRDGSVFLLVNGQFEAQFSKTQVPSKVRAIAQDNAGVLWFGGTQGLASLEGETVRQFNEDDGVGDLDLTVLQPYPGGKIIAGSSNGTILLGDSSGFTDFATPETFKHQWISGILTVSPYEIWVSTLGSGLYLWDGERWHCFDSEAGLPDSRLTCIVNDGRGFVWFGSLGGIIRAERKALLAYARKLSPDVKWLRLDHTDGLPSRECIGGYQPAGWRGRDGSLWFPTGAGIARVRPDLVDRSQVAPPVFLQSARVNGVLENGNGNGPITPAPGRARLEFRFVGLSFSAPEKITYRARLAGLNDAWRELGTQRVAAFEAVPPGNYTFEVMAVNGDGMRSPAPASVAIVIKPRFWETAWFYLSLGGSALLIALATGWGAARMKMKSRIQFLKIRNARESERSRIARDLHDDLGASLTEISILAALAAEDADTTPLQPALNQLSVKAKHVVGSLDEIVWAVNPREDTLRSLIDYIAAFAREFLDIAGIPLRLDVPNGIPECALATSRRHGIFLAAREALNNIVKHAGATEVLLQITLTNDLLEIRIEDNGRGFNLDYASSSGNGIGNLEQRMEEAGGTCRIETSRSRGTTVFLELPLLASA